MNTNDQAPESCPFCGAGIIIMADGRECRSQNQWVSFQCFTNWHRNYREPRKLQSSICEDGERRRLICENERLTRERDEAKKAAETAMVELGQVASSRRDLLSRVKHLESEWSGWEPLQKEWFGDKYAAMQPLDAVRARIEDTEARVQRLEEAGSWIPASTKPEGWERKVLCWVVWPACGWPAPPEAIIGWWKHGPGCFAVQDVENADHLVTHWMEIINPTQAKEATP